MPNRRAAPFVAVTATTEIIRGLSRVRVNEAYIAAITGAGLLPVVISPMDAGHACDVVDGVAGLLLTGGEDVGPHHFGAEPHPTVEVHEGRDSFELALVRAARERALPTLAICRGLQLANVAFGGTLIQDLPSARPDALDHAPENARTRRVHEVAVRPSSRLASALGTTHLTTNSSHHQSLDRIARELVVTAHAPDGIVEGAEWASEDWWLLGVQWHPEELLGTADGWDRALFAAFATVVYNY